MWIDFGEPRKKQCEGILAKEAGAKSLRAMFLTLDLIQNRWEIIDVF